MDENEVATEVDKPKPKKQLSEKQLAQLAKAREKANAVRKRNAEMKKKEKKTDFEDIVTKFLKRSEEKQIDILHLHDWITGACAPLYKERFQALDLKVGKVITTIHNMCYQGEILIPYRF